MNCKKAFLWILDGGEGRESEQMKRSAMELGI